MSASIRHDGVQCPSQRSLNRHGVYPGLLTMSNGEIDRLSVIQSVLEKRVTQHPTIE